MVALLVLLGNPETGLAEPANGAANLFVEDLPTEHSQRGFQLPVVQVDQLPGLGPFVESAVLLNPGDGVVGCFLAEIAAFGDGFFNCMTRNVSKALASIKLMAVPINRKHLISGRSATIPKTASSKYLVLAK